MNDKFSQPLYCQCLRTGPYNLTIPIYGAGMRMRAHIRSHMYARAYAYIYCIYNTISVLILYRVC